MFLTPVLRVAGVGDGVFILLFFFAIAILITAFAMQARRPAPIIVGAFSVPIILLIFFVIIPKRSGDERHEEYDQWWYVLFLMKWRTLFRFFFLINCPFKK